MASTTDWRQCQKVRQEVWNKYQRRCERVILEVRNKYQRWCKRVRLELRNKDQDSPPVSTSTTFLMGAACWRPSEKAHHRYQHCFFPVTNIMINSTAIVFIIINTIPIFITIISTTSLLLPILWSKAPLSLSSTPLSPSLLSSSLLLHCYQHYYQKHC